MCNNINYLIFQILVSVSYSLACQRSLKPSRAVSWLSRQKLGSSSWEPHHEMMIQMMTSSYEISFASFCLSCLILHSPSQNTRSTTTTAPYYIELTQEIFANLTRSNNAKCDNRKQFLLHADESDLANSIMITIWAATVTTELHYAICYIETSTDIVQAHTRQ